MAEIGSEAHKLDEGTLLLVLNVRGKLHIKHLQLATLNLKPEGALSPDQLSHECLKGLARTNPELHSLFAGADRGKWDRGESRRHTHRQFLRHLDAGQHQAVRRITPTVSNPVFATCLPAAHTTPSSPDRLHGTTSV